MKDSEALIFSRLNDLKTQKLLSMATNKALVVCGAYAALFSLKKKMEQNSKSDQASLTSSERTLLRLELLLLSNSKGELRTGYPDSLPT